MSDNPKCQNCDEAEKRAIAVVVCVSALGLEFLDTCNDPSWKQAIEIVKKLKEERNALLVLMKEVRDRLDDDPDDDAPDWCHIIARQIDAITGKASNHAGQPAVRLSPESQG